MAFTDTQVRALTRRVPSRRIKTRVSDGKELSYIEGWYAIDQANRIFGFDGWDRETVELARIDARQEPSGSVVIYCARVRVTVRSGDTVVVRDGRGTGEARANSLGEAHDRAMKAAETDATKRALATFGKAFGLALYAGLRGASAKGPSISSSKASDSNWPPTPRSEGAEPRATADVQAKRPPINALPRVNGAGALSVTNGSPANNSALRARNVIDKSALTFSEPRRVRDKDHLRHVASQPCILCGKTPADAHHLGFAQPRAMGRKASDEFTVPLCRGHHQELHHEGNEAAWWHDIGIDPLTIARDLWLESQKSQANPLEERSLTGQPHGTNLSDRTHFSRPLQSGES